MADKDSVQEEQREKTTADHRPRRIAGLPAGSAFLLLALLSSLPFARAPGSRRGLCR
jgi:hypothetical protein